MLNELDEYLNVLNYLLNGMVPDTHPIHQHILWLLDAEGHASFIGSDLDMVEKDVIKKSKEFKKEFAALQGFPEGIARVIREEAGVWHNIPPWLRPYGQGRMLLPDQAISSLLCEAAGLRPYQSPNRSCIMSLFY